MCFHHSRGSFQFQRSKSVKAPGERFAEAAIIRPGPLQGQPGRSTRVHQCEGVPASNSNPQSVMPAADEGSVSAAMTSDRAGLSKHTLEATAGDRSVRRTSPAKSPNAMFLQE